MNYTYLLLCNDGTIYCGWTVNLTSRLKAHNEGKGAKYTASRRPVTLLTSWTFKNKHEAQQAEWWIKKLSRKQKLQLATKPELLKILCPKITANES